MKYYILIVTLFLSFQVFGKSEDTIVIIGDSITDGYGVTVEKAYPFLLQKAISKQFPKVKIVASAISGSVTASAHSRLQWITQNEKDVKGIVVVLGGNDLMRGIKPATMEKNYQKLLDVAKKHKLPMLLATMPLPMNYSGYQQDLDSIYARLEKNNDVTLLKNFLQGIVGVPSMNQTDGIHPNELGHELIVSNIKDQLIKWLKRIRK